MDIEFTKNVLIVWATRVETGFLFSSRLAPTRRSNNYIRITEEATLSQRA